VGSPPAISQRSCLRGISIPYARSPPFSTTSRPRTLQREHLIAKYKKQGTASSCVAGRDGNDGTQRPASCPWHRCSSRIFPGFPFLAPGFRVVYHMPATFDPPKSLALVLSSQGCLGAATTPIPPRPEKPGIGKLPISGHVHKDYIRFVQRSCEPEPTNQFWWAPKSGFQRGQYRHFCRRVPFLRP